MAKSSTKRANRKKPSAAKKNAASKASKTKIAPAKASRKSKKTHPRPAKNHSAKKPAKAARPVIAKSKPKAKPAPAIKKIAAKAAASVKSAAKAKPEAAVKPKRRAGIAVAAKPEPARLAPPVATNLKPKKNLAGLGVKELERFADQLLAKRRELVGDMSSMEREALRSGSNSNLSTLPMHMADMGTDNFEQEFTLGLVEKDRNLLREINHALSKIQNGTYGICEGTGLTISKARLEAAPWARYSIEYARQKEKNGMGVRTL